MRQFIFTIIAVTALATATAAALASSTTGSITPAPYIATYVVNYRGVEVGRLRFELRTEEAGRFVFETRAEPGMIASFVVGSDAVERSVMHIDQNGVRPLSWYLDDGKPGDAKDGALTFDWDEKRITGIVEGQRVQLPTEPQLQDRLSLQIAVLTTLLRGQVPSSIPLIDHNKIKRYSYRRTGAEQIKTPAGEFATVLYESTRPGSSRVSRVWHAPTLDYIPVRAEQVRKGKVETVMELIQVQLSN